MKATTFAIFLLFIFGGIASCSGGPSSNREEATGEGAIRALHAIPDLGAVTFLIEETELATIDFKEASGTEEFDDLTFKFNFDIELPDDTQATRLVSLEVKVDDEIEYTFVLAGTLDDPEIILWEQFRRDWAAELDQAADNGTEITILDISYGNLALGLGDIDIYIDTPGVVPVDGNQAATLSFGNFQKSAEIEAGQYQVIVTNGGDPSTFLFASEPFTLTSATTTSIVVMDGDASGIADFSIRLLGDGTGTELTDINAESTMRVAHAAFNTDALDVIVADEFAMPFAADVQFGDLTPQADIPDGELDLNVTPSGHPGSFLAEETISIAKGGRHTLFLTGLPGRLDGILLGDQTRRLSTHAFLRLYQGSERVPSIDFYLVPSGSDIALLSPTIARLPYTGSSGYQQIVPDTYDLIYTLPDTKTIVAGPLRVNLNALGIYDAITADSIQTDIAQLLFFADE